MEGEKRHTVPETKGKRLSKPRLEDRSCRRETKGHISDGNGSAADARKGQGSQEAGTLGLQLNPPRKKFSKGRNCERWGKEKE